MIFVVPPFAFIKFSKFPDAIFCNKDSERSKFDFPDPFGPIKIVSGPGSQTTSLRDLNPFTSKRLMSIGQFSRGLKFLFRKWKFPFTAGRVNGNFRRM